MCVVVRKFGVCKLRRWDWAAEHLKCFKAKDGKCLAWLNIQMTPVPHSLHWSTHSGAPNSTMLHPQGLCVCVIVCVLAVGTCTLWMQEPLKWGGDTPEKGPGNGWWDGGRHGNFVLHCPSEEAAGQGPDGGRAWLMGVTLRLSAGCAGRHMRPSGCNRARACQWRLCMQAVRQNYRMLEHD